MAQTNTCLQSQAQFVSTVHHSHLIRIIQRACLIFGRFSVFVYKWLRVCLSVGVFFLLLHILFGGPTKTKSRLRKLDVIVCGREKKNVILKRNV